MSLSEAPENEIPVAAALVDYIGRRRDASAVEGDFGSEADSYMPERRRSRCVNGVGGDNPVVVINPLEKTLGDYIEVDAAQPAAGWLPALEKSPDKPVVITTSHVNRPGSILAAARAIAEAGMSHPVIPMIDYGNASFDDTALMAAADFGCLILNGLHDGVWIKNSRLDDEEVMRVSLGILQATRLRISRTEYIACPGCGRTLFDLQSTLKAVKEATAHLKGLKIGVMGCIVNGPGEMADADYGYVGAASGHVSLYKGKTCVEKNIPQEEAIPHLVELIKSCGDWKDA